jgi:EmrB/QacA subfamily drug resistance transporter
MAHGPGMIFNRFPSNRWAPLAAICLGTFMLLVDVTIVTVALPDMVSALHAGFSSLQWVIDAYALALAALLLGAGSLADRLGRRRIYLAGLVVFALASLACGVAPSSAVLIAARAVQGAGAAAMLAMTLALLSTTYRGADRGTAFGVWGATSAAAAAAGPLLGGLLTQGLSWRWIFFVNLPIAAATIVLAALALHEPPEGEHRPGGVHRLDLPGVGAFTLAAGAATAALVRVPQSGWGAASTLGLLAVAAVAVVAFVAIERHGDAPMFDLALLRCGPFSGVLIAATLLSAAAFATLVYASLWLQSALGLSPIAGGLVLAPLAVSSLLVSLIVGRFLHGRAARLAIGIGLLAIGTGDLLQIGLGRGSDWPALITGFVVTGIGVGLATPTLASAAMAAVPPARAGMAAGAVNTARQLGLALGIGALGSIYDGRAAAHGAAHALSTVFLAAGAAGLAAGTIALILIRPAATTAASAVRTGSIDEPRAARASQ